VLPVNLPKYSETLHALLRDLMSHFPAALYVSSVLEEHCLYQVVAVSSVLEEHCLYQVVAVGSVLAEHCLCQVVAVGSVLAGQFDFLMSFEVYALQ